MKKILTILLALTACAALILTREKEPEYLLSTVQMRTIREEIEAVGTVGYAENYAVMAGTAGKIARVFVEKGEYVGAGQAIAEVELLPEDAVMYLANLQNVDMDKLEAQERLMQMCTVTAPAAGIVTMLEIYEGMQVVPAVALGSVSTVERSVTAYIPESVREDIFEGQKAVIRRGDSETEGIITEITPSLEAAGQYAVEFALDGSADALEAGMKVDVEILVEECSGPSVPLQAIHADGTVRCRMEDGIAAVPVETGLCSETCAQLLSGPPLGTQVVIGEAE